MNKIKDFIGIFPNAASPEYCESIIERFEYINQTDERMVVDRQMSDNVPPIEKDNNQYFLNNSGQFQNDTTILDRDTPLIIDFKKITHNCYSDYQRKYGYISSLYDNMTFSPYVKIQKNKPSEGYHVWHCDADGLGLCRRFLVTMLYLNTVTSGGETEFLYQSLRVKPVQGTLILFPAYFTHPHRGNPPLKDNKYVINSWLEFNK